MFVQRSEFNSGQRTALYNNYVLLFIIIIIYLPQNARVTLQAAATCLPSIISSLPQLVTSLTVLAACFPLVSLPCMSQLSAWPAFDSALVGYITASLSFSCMLFTLPKFVTSLSVPLACHSYQLDLLSHLPQLVTSLPVLALAACFPLCLGSLHHCRSQFCVTAVSLICFRVCLSWLHHCQSQLHAFHFASVPYITVSHSSVSQLSA